MNRWRVGIVRVPPFLFSVFVIAYAVLACLVLTTDKLAGGWPGLAVYAIGCVLVFLAFARKRKGAGREAHNPAEQAQGDRTESVSPADSVGRVERIRDRIRMRKSDGRKEE